MVSFTNRSVFNTEWINGEYLQKGYSVFTNLQSITGWSVLHSNTLKINQIKCKYSINWFNSLKKVWSRLELGWIYHLLILNCL